MNTANQMLFITIIEERENPIMASNYATLNPMGNIGPHDLMTKYPFLSPNFPIIKIAVAGHSGYLSPSCKWQDYEAASNIYQINTNMMDDDTPPNTTKQKDIDTNYSKYASNQMPLSNIQEYPLIFMTEPMTRTTLRPPR